MIRIGYAPKIYNKNYSNNGTPIKQHSNKNATPSFGNYTNPMYDLGHSITEYYTTERFYGELNERIKNLLLEASSKNRNTPTLDNTRLNKALDALSIAQHYGGMPIILMHLNKHNITAHLTADDLVILCKRQLPNGQLKKNTDFLRSLDQATINALGRNRLMQCLTDAYGEFDANDTKVVNSLTGKDHPLKTITDKLPLGEKYLALMRLSDRMSKMSEQVFSVEAVEEALNKSFAPGELMKNSLFICHLDDTVLKKMGEKEIIKLLQAQSIDYYRITHELAHTYMEGSETLFYEIEKSTNPHMKAFFK